MISKDIVFVLGMGRSGSSALTRVLSLCGGTLPRTVLAPREINPTGFWEPLDATKLNYEFLHTHSSPPCAPPIHLPVKITCLTSDRESFIKNIRMFLAGCSASSILVIKCLGLTELKEFWSHAALSEGFAVKVVIPVRHPREVFSSLQAAKLSSATITEDTAYASWLRENLLAELQSRDVPRVVVEYSNLLNNWRTEIARVSKALSIDFKVDEAAIDHFLTRDLYRQRYSAAPTGAFAFWTSRIYELLSAAAQDKPIDISELDNIRQSYCASENVFRSLARSRIAEDRRKYRDEMDRWPIWTAGRDY